MNKIRTLYVCDACGARSPKWAGQCPDCGAWNTLVESRAPEKPARGRLPRTDHQAQIRPLPEVHGENTPRISTGLAELDRVLGGGLVAGSVTLIGGDPGIGKSTLLLQAAANLADVRSVLYVTGEESPEQVGLRAQRLSVAQQPLQLAAETCIERMLETAETLKPAVLVVDSIQTVYTEILQSAPGSVAQLRESTGLLVRFAKSRGTAVLLVGHVTKEGAIAGPRVLEHMVDTVLYFENDAGSRYRVIRAVKNRFGAANELGVFAMTETGLKEVKNPSAIFLSRHAEPVSGSAITVIREGSRPMLIEVQALVDESPLANPRRVAVGLDANRLSMLLAVLHRHAGIAMFDRDVFVNVVGGLRLSETAADLPILMAALSSFRDQPLPNDLVLFGEVGLAGEIRPIYNGEERLREAAKHGFKHAMVPKGNAPRGGLDGLQITQVSRLSEALQAVQTG
ncbi:MAG: DNA repair protein RadA [Gammaproteobacteria bacterium]|nr:DNA repair protein RadA [Gammaproteobacteria bacterium]MBU6509642.1 DNA repair protein RadA [Gammaproteobacteria bacterium]MDE2108237.1 DNA repair protein RadA [Gammaproteobacteria bacterium]MDE2461420.1 DNA repair protein RadA [Gammaproteobacteria bacterium]